MSVRVLLTAGGLLALWGLVSLLPLLRAWVLPVELTLQVRPVAPALAVQSTTPGPWQRLKAEVTQRTSVEGFALGDGIQFDRYGTVPAAVGTVYCTWLAPGHRPVQVVPIGGARHHAAAVSVTVASDLPGCPEFARP